MRWINKLSILFILLDFVDQILPARRWKQIRLLRCIIGCRSVVLDDHGRCFWCRSVWIEHIFKTLKFNFNSPTFSLVLACSLTSLTEVSGPLRPVYLSFYFCMLFAGIWFDSTERLKWDICRIASAVVFHIISSPSSSPLYSRSGHSIQHYHV